MKHTPTPWIADRFLVSEAARPYPRGDGIAHAGGFSRSNAESEANANFICLAANCHDELVAALSELTELMEGVIEGDYKPDSFTLQPARAALAKATGVTP